MATQYKPTKAPKVKPAKAPKAAKAEKTVKFSSSAQSVKFDKPKKIKEPKAPKAPKPEMAATFKPGKVEKVSDVKVSGKLRKPVNPKVMVAVFAVVIVAVVAVVIGAFFTGGGSFADDTPTVTPENLTITALPDKTVYHVGDEPSYYGLKVEVTLSNGVAVTLSSSDCQITGFDSSAPAASQTITVAYQNLSANYAISIQEKPGQSEGESPSTPTVTGQFNGISFKTLPQTEYKVGDWPSVEGGVLLRHYEDGTTKELALEFDYLYGFTTQTAGAHTVTVKYIENGFLATCEYTITVTE